MSNLVNLKGVYDLIRPCDIACKNSFWLASSLQSHGIVTFSCPIFLPQYIPSCFHFYSDTTMLPTILSQILDEVFKYRNLNISQLVSFSPQFYVFYFPLNITIIHQIALGDTRRTFQIYRTFPGICRSFPIIYRSFWKSQAECRKTRKVSGDY